MTISIVEPLGMADDELRSYLEPITEAGHEIRTYPDRPQAAATLIERARGAEAVVLSNIPVPREVVAACPELGFLCVAFAGVDHVDLEACRDHGVVVSNAAGYPTQSVAEHTIALTLAILRRVVASDAATRSGGTRSGLIGHELNGKTVGVVGTGAIGRRTAQLFAAFGARLLGYNRTRYAEMERLGMQYLDLESLLAASDIVTLHLPLTPATRGLISSERIAGMKPGAILVNVARGAVVDSEALARALHENRLGGAGLDVFETEPPIAAEHPLLKAPNTVVAPHVAFATAESFVRRAEIVCENLVAWLDGTPVRTAEIAS